MIPVFYYVLAGFGLEFFTLYLMFCFGIKLVLTGREKTSDIQKQYNIGLGLFFISVALSALLYIIDLSHRQFSPDGARLFPAEEEYTAMGRAFASLHTQFYFILIFVFLLLSLGFLMHPIELHLMKRQRPILSKTALIMSPMPIIVRILEYYTLPQEGEPIYWVYSALYAVMWLIVGLCVFTMLGLYFKTMIKSAGDIRKRSFAIVLSLVIWLVAIFTRSQFLKGIAERPYMFWMLPTLEMILLYLFIYGFGTSIEFSFSDSKEGHLYSHWFFKIFIYGFVVLVSAYGSVIFWNQDLDFVFRWVGKAASDPQLAEFATFIDQSLFEGDGLGGQDFSYIFLAILILPYFASYIGPVKAKFSTIRKYGGFAIMSAIALAIINRGFKTFFARARPGDAMQDSTMFSRMWMIGKYELEDGFSKGSFTSGHTTTAVMIVIFAFILIKAHKTWLITLAFTATIGWTVVMGFGRVVRGAHYPSDTLWAIILGLAIIAWVYFVVLKMPEQEEGTFQVYAKFGELRWGILFVFFAVFVLAGFLGIKYTYMDFEWYWAVATVAGPLLAWLVYRRMQFLINGPVQKAVSAN